MSELQPILAAVQQAAQLCQQIQQTLVNASEKADREPVTIADYGSQAIICRAIREHFPDDGVLAEESGEQFIELVAPPQRDKITQQLSTLLGETVTEETLVTWLNHGHNRESKRTWVIDPIDGTKGFLASRRYAIAVGLLDAGQPVAGIIGSPGYPLDDQVGRLFYATPEAAYMQPLHASIDAPRQAIQVSSRTLSDSLRVVESVEPSHADHDTMARVREIAGLQEPQVDQIDGQDKYAAVACGDADFYLRLSPKKNYKHKIWDHIGGYMLVKAAGGTITDLDGTPLGFSNNAILPNEGMLVTNGLIHDQVIAALQQVLG